MNTPQDRDHGAPSPRWRKLASRLWHGDPRPRLSYDREPRSEEAVAPDGVVDVIVPIHGAAAAAKRCLDSVFAHTDLSRHRLVVIVDGDPEIRREEMLPPSTGGEEPRVEWLENAACRGFVASVNRGMEHSTDDVVLLNSDTIVTSGWLEKLRAAAYSASEIATVTPFSNHATICSLPQTLVRNALPIGHDVDSFARLVEEVAVRQYPGLPTGVGMCLFIKRRALERVGLFDEKTFGPGYGEETDFCFRALKVGFSHVLDDATFIFHEGEGSFGEKRAHRINIAERNLRRKHPEYVATLAHYLRQDPTRQARQRVIARLAPDAPSNAAASPARVLHLVHGWPPSSHGGTELYAYWLAAQQKSRRTVAVYARVGDPERQNGEVTEIYDGGVRVRLVVNNFTQRDPRVRNALRDPDRDASFARFLDDFQPDLVHVHHLAGHAFSLVSQVATRRIPIVYQVQDWWALCPRVNLLPPNRELCSGPAPSKCARCMPLTGIAPVGLWNLLLYGYRARLARRCLNLADAYVMGSRAIERDYRAGGLLRDPDHRVHVLSYGVERPSARPIEISAKRERPLRCGYVGTLMPHKGVHVAVRAFADIERTLAELEIWGDTAAAPEYVRELEQAVGRGAVVLRGRFEESDKGGIYRRFDVLLVPSLGLESFGLVAREAMAHGVPVIASRRGALEELLTGDPPRGGAYVEPGDAEELRTLIEKLVQQPEMLARWRRELPLVVGLAEHAAEMEQVYRQTLARFEAAS